MKHALRLHFPRLPAPSAAVLAKVLAIVVSGSHASAVAATIDDCLRDNIAPASEVRGADGAYQGTAVAAPMGSYLFIKWQGATCAVRFVRVCRLDDGDASSLFTNGAPTLGAAYESVFPAGPAGQVFRGSVLAAKSFGIGRVAVQTGGSRTVNCGAFEVLWNYPVDLLFVAGKNSRRLMYDESILMAPTGVDSMDRINIQDERLVWYSLGKSSVSRVVIPKESLPD